MRGLEEQVFVHVFRQTSTQLALLNGANERDPIALNGWTSGAMLARYGASAAQERAIAEAPQPGRPPDDRA